MDHICDFFFGWFICCFFCVWSWCPWHQENFIHPSLVPRRRWNQNFTFGKNTGTTLNNIISTWYLVINIFHFFLFILGGWGNLIVKKMLSILCWCICSRRHEQCPSLNLNPYLKTRPLSGPKCYILKLVSWHFKPSQPQRITSGLIIFCWSASFPSER